MTQKSKVAELFSDLLSDDGKTINQAIMAFGTLHQATDKDEAFRELTQLLGNPNPWFRARAVSALGTLGDRRAIPLLIDSLSDDDEEAGTDLIQSRFDVLVSFKDPRAIRPLIEQLYRVDFKRGWDFFAFGDEAVVPMIEALKAHPYADIRWQAAYYFLNKRDERAILPLIDAATNDDNERVRISAIGALGTNGSSEVVPYLKNLASESNPKIRQAVAIALGRIGDLTAISVLQKLSDDENPKVREAAAEAITKLPQRKAHWFHALLQYAARRFRKV